MALQRAMILVAAMLLLQSVASGDASRIRRQTGNDIEIDINAVSDEVLLCLLEGSTTEGGDGRDCFGNLKPTGDTGVVPTQQCQCVPWYRCRDNLVTPRPDGGLLGIVNVRTSAGCDVVENVCCVDPEPDQGVPPVPTPIIKPCGSRNPAGVGAIFTELPDRQAQFGEYPWMAAIITSDLSVAQGANVYVGGGSLIHPQVILTGAHVVHGYLQSQGQLKVRLGEWNFKAATESILHQDIPIAAIYTHPAYVHQNLENDYALLYLEYAAELGPTVNTICLPEPTDALDENACISSGWGKDVFGQHGKYQQILKSIYLPVVDNYQCEDAMRTTRLGQYFNLHESFMCAGGVQGNDVCTGDGGSPLVCPYLSDRTRYAQVGIVAWGIGCGEEGIPGVYADVRHGLPWIQSEVQSLTGFDVRNKPAV